MPVLFQFPRPRRSSKARPLHSAMRKSGSKLSRRRMKTVHFAKTKTLLSAPRTPPTLPLIPYDEYTPSPQSASYPRGLHTPTASYDSGMPLPASAGPYTPSSSAFPASARHLPPDLISYYQPSSSTLKPLPTSSVPRVVHAETVPLDVEWDCAWEGEPEHGGRVIRRGREKIPRERLPKTPHPRKAIDLHATPSVEDFSYFAPPSSSRGAVWHGQGEGEVEERGRSRRREMLERLTGRSRSRSQQPAPHAQHQAHGHLHPQSQPQPHTYAQTQHHHQTGGNGLLQVPQRQRHGSFSSTTSGPQVQMQMSSSAPSASHMRSSPHTSGQGQMQPGYVYPPPPSHLASSPSAQSHTHPRSRTSSFNTPHPQAQPQPLSYSHSQSHHRHHSASTYPAPPPTPRRRSHSNPPEERYAFPSSPITPHYSSQPQAGLFTPQTSSHSQFLSVPSRDGGHQRQRQRQRAGSLSYGATLQPPPSPHVSVNGSVKTHAQQQQQQKPQVLRRRTASNPHLPSSGHRTHHHQLSAHHAPSATRHRSGTAATPHRYLAVSSSSQPQISWDVRLPASTATRTRVPRGAAHSKVHYLSPQALVEPATVPPTAFMRVSAIRSAHSGAREAWPWPIAVYPQGGSSQAVTLDDVLHAVHAALRTRASEKEYEKLLPDRMDKKAVSEAYEGRWREESRTELRSAANHGKNDKKAEVGLRRVDFLRGRTVFVGLEPVGGVEGEWCLVVR